MRPFEKLNSEKHCLRVNDYSHYYASFDESLQNLVGAEKGVIDSLTAELENSNFMDHIDKCLREEKIDSSMSLEMGKLLYSLVRITRPEIVVETGVAAGVSSSFILYALEKNGWGKLYSVDLHYREGVFTPSNKKLGWIVPQELRSRWTLVLGESIKVLPKLLADLRKIDIFLHDSRHLYKTMISEYTIAWPFLKDGGLLLSDDVVCNDAFLEFSGRFKQNPSIFSRIGAIRKQGCNTLGR